MELVSLGLDLGWDGLTGWLQVFFGYVFQGENPLLVPGGQDPLDVGHIGVGC